MRWRKLYICGACGKKGAYADFNSTSSGLQMMYVKCRNCQASEMFSDIDRPLPFVEVAASRLVKPVAALGAEL
jgi:hypothetical protein